MLERRIQDLPAEAKDVLQKINLSFRFPNIKDGSIYRNRERILPEVTICEYYKEYTVPTPNQVGRGMRRLVIGNGGEIYYTEDHYVSFKRIIDI